jgi:hypothetical protein
MTRGISRTAWSLRRATKQPGNSGGALVDERGNAVGVVSAKLDAAAALSASGALPENVNLRGQEQLSPELSGVGAGGFGEAQRTGDGWPEV